MCKDKRTAVLSGARYCLPPPPLGTRLWIPSRVPRNSSKLPFHKTMLLRQRGLTPLRLLLACGVLSLLICRSRASLGDHLPEFRECVEVLSSAPWESANTNSPVDLQGRELRKGSCESAFVSLLDFWRVRLTFLQRCTSAFCSGTVPPSVTTPANMWSPTPGLLATRQCSSRSSNTMASGRSIGSWAFKSRSRSFSPSSTSSRTSTG